MMLNLDMPSNICQRPLWVAYKKIRKTLFFKISPHLTFPANWDPFLIEKRQQQNCETSQRFQYCQTRQRQIWRQSRLFLTNWKINQDFLQRTWVAWQGHLWERWWPQPGGAGQPFLVGMIIMMIMMIIILILQSNQQSIGSLRICWIWKKGPLS